MTATDTDLTRPEGQEAEARKAEAEPDCKTRLPGLTLVFFISLCAGGALCGMFAFWALRELVQNATWYFGDAYIFMILAAVGILGAALAWWAGYGIYERLESAPRRCRVLLVLNMVAAAAGVAGIGAILLTVGLRGVLTPEFFIRHNIPAVISNFLAIIIISEAWRRYFWLSPKVRRTFNSCYPMEYAKNIPPAEIALFTVACWLCPVHYGLPNLAWMAFYWTDTGAGEKLRLLPSIIITTAYIALPCAALYALRLRQGMLRVIFWCLGLWLAVEAAVGLLNLINTARALSAMNDYGDGYNYAGGLPRLFSERLFIPLAFWWYFSVSQKARAWFGAERLPWEGKAARF